MSEQQYKLVITRKGLDECISAEAKGLSLPLKWVSAGDQAYTPSPAQTTLHNELQRVEFSEYKNTASNQIQAVAKFSGPKQYPIRELGFWLETGTLLGVISAPNVTLNYKPENGHCVQPFTLDLSALPTDSVNVVVGTENLNILIDEEMMMDAVSFLRSQVVQVNQAHMNMQLSENLRKSQGVIKQLQVELIAATQRLDEKVNVQREQIDNEIEVERMSDMEIFIRTQAQQIKQAEMNIVFDDRLRNVEIK
ncbi:phage tail protein [Photobacterium swingsii]|uniref:phage tail-collar fiber domain-containing protein n=1 Tax=Photobacterium swingsii TaxID=680026 RepID=UPI00352F37B7